MNDIISPYTLATYYPTRSIPSYLYFEISECVTKAIVLQLSGDNFLSTFAPALANYLRT